MSLNYSFTGDWTGSTKESVSKWVKQKLTIVQDGEAPEDLFLEYIIVMIGNGKRMQELSHELQDFIGEKSANDFAADLGEYLQNLTPAESPAAPPLQTAQPQTVSTAETKVKKDVLEGGLQSSRTVGQKNSRLLDSALRSTALPQKRNVPVQPVSSTGLAAKVPQQSTPVGPGLFTKRGIAKTLGGNHEQEHVNEDVNKRRKIIMEGRNTQAAGSSNKAIVRSFDSRTIAAERQSGIEGHRFNVQNFSSTGSSNPHPPAHVDPGMVYMDQMIMMARMSGFASVEDMMFFQQNMVANMMGGMMQAPPPFAGQISPFEQQRQQQQPMYSHKPPPPANFDRGHGRVQGGRGRGGDGRGFNGNQKYPHAPAGDIHATQHIVQPPPGPPPTTVKPIQSTIEVISPAIAKVEGAVPLETVEDQHECIFGYSGGGGPGGFRGRGRGRGRGPSRGGYQGSESDMGGRGAPDASASGDLVGHMGRGRGGFRGRGYVSEGAFTTEKIPTAGPPASRNKVWVREVDMESSLVAGR